MAGTAVSREELEARLAELREVQEEADRIRRMLAVWDAPSNDQKPAGTSATAPRSSGRAGRGQRPDEFLQAVEHNPGIRAADIYRRMPGVNQNYVYRLAKELEKDGKVCKFHNGYFLPGQEPSDGAAGNDPEPDSE